MISVAFIATCHLLMASTAGASREEFSVISPEIDQALSNAPPEFWQVFGIISAVLGLLFAFFGANLLRTQATFYSGCLAGGGAAFLLSLIPPNVNEEDGEEEPGVAPGVWLGVVLTSAILFGYLFGRIVMLRKAYTLLVFAATLAALWNQYVLSYFNDALPSWTPWAVYVVALLFSTLLFWRYGAVAVIIATSLLGAFVVLLSTALLLGGELSLSGMFGGDPNYMVACTTAECWGPLVIAILVFVLGMRFQLYMKQRREDAADTHRVEPSPSSADLLREGSTHSDVQSNPFAPEKDEQQVELAPPPPYKERQMAYV